MAFHRRKLLGMGVLALALAATGAPSFAQAFPNKPVTLIVPFAPGGNTDMVARTAGAALQRVLGQSVIIENRAGGGGSIGANIVARAPADGYTLLVAGGGVVAVLPEMIKTPFKLESFAPLTMINKSSMVLVARKKETKFKDFNDLAAYARSAQGKLTAAHSGPGTPNQLALLQLEDLLKAKFTVVSYKGAGPALVDVIGGQVDVLFDQITSSSQHIKAGSLQALAVLGPSRDAAVADVATVSELGYGKIDGTTYLGILAPAGTPKDIQDKLVAAWQQATKDPQLIAAVRDMGSLPIASSGPEFEKQLRFEQELAVSAVKEGRLKVD